MSMPIDSSIRKVIAQKLFWFAATLSASVGGYAVGYSNGFDSGISGGYIRGQVELSLALQDGLNSYVSENSIDNSYSHFLDVKDITIYLHDEGGGRKTLAFWQSE